MITIAHRMESLSRAYLQAVAAQVGLNYCLHAYDYGIDVTLREVEHLESRYLDSGRSIDIQLKCTTRAIESDSEIKYDLDVRTYDYLRETQTAANRLLVVLALPVDEDHWVSQTENGLSINGCAYWFGLRGCPAISSKSTTRVAIPRQNMLSIQVVKDLLAMPIRSGERWKLDFEILGSIDES